MATSAGVRAQNCRPISKLGSGQMRIKAPRGQPYFCYTLCVLDHVFCELDQVTLSNFTTLKKARKVTSPVGKQLLGPEAIEQSNKIADRVWNYKELATSYAVFPPFNPEVFVYSRFQVEHCRRYDWSDCVLEVRFRADDHTNSNTKLETTQRQLRQAVTAMRLLSDAPIRALGPVEVRAHPAAGGAGIGTGNLNDEVLSGKVEIGRFLELDTRSCRQLKTLFNALSHDLPDAILIAMARLNMSFTRGNTVDQFIDTIIGLEALYLAVDNGELRFRLALRVSVHQEVEPELRWQKFKAVQFLYDARSKLVHGSKHGLSKLLTKKSPYRDEPELLAAARSTLRLGCKQAVLDHARQPVDWSKYLERIDRAVLCGG